MTATPKRMPFFTVEDFRMIEPGAAAERANEKLEASFGNEYDIVMFWKETMLSERERADAAERELEATKKDIAEYLNYAMRTRVANQKLRGIVRELLERAWRRRRRTSRRAVAERG